MKVSLKIFCTIICVGLLIAGISAYKITGDIMNLVVDIIILFILFWMYKPRRKKSTYVEKTPVKITDEQIPALIQEGYRAALEAEKNSPNPKFHRTLREEDLSFNFSQNHADRLAKLEDDIYETANNIGNVSKKFLNTATKDDIQEMINRCQTAIDAFEKCKKFCYGKGKGGTIYFQDMWEFCHSSKDECFSYVQSTINLKLQLEELLKTK